MKNYYGGCDVGSTTGKAIIMNDDGIITSCIIKSKIDPAETGKLVLNEAIKDIKEINDISELKYLVGTGYGRNEVPFANENISEITCHAVGTNFVDPEVRTIVDIGGQDVKAISINEKGSVVEFAMNEKCAAGTGRFFEMMSRLFDMNLDEFSNLSLGARKVVSVTSQCSVFAETEVVSLIAKRKRPEDIAAGIQQSVAKRVFTLVRKVNNKPKLTITGGCSRNKGLKVALEKILRTEISDLDIDPQLMGALGAAVKARQLFRG